MAYKSGADGVAKKGKTVGKSIGGSGGGVSAKQMPHDQANTNSLGNNGYPETGTKTSGIKIRGTGAATKGTMARGPMA